jgi:flagellar biosynthesis/type III secretory pathway chaperone
MALSVSISAAERLGQILDDEFEALKAQNLESFEELQGEKVALIASLAGVSPPQTGHESPEWIDFQELVLGCRDKHRRNSLLIQRKLDAIRAALKTLQGVDPASSVEVYDRLGRLAGARRRSGYAQA